MNSATIPPLAALVIQSALGLSVFQANPRRTANQCFLLLSVVIAAVLTSLYFGLHTAEIEIAERCVRWASASGILIIVTLNLLRFSIRKKESAWLGILKHGWVWVISGIAAVALCQTTFFLKSVRFSPQFGEAISPLIPVYGRGFIIYSVFFVIASVVTIINYVQDVRHSSGGEHAELAFILIGTLSTIAIGVGIAFTLGF